VLEGKGQVLQPRLFRTRKMARRAAFLKPDGTRLQINMEDFLGSGTNAIVFRDGPHALKIPKAYDPESLPEEERDDQEYINDGNIQMLELEKAVYRRVGYWEGIAECIDVSEAGIRLAVYKQGDLENYTNTHTEVNSPQKAKWILSVVQTIFHLHSLKVLVDDLALRNILIGDDMSLKFIDFGSCVVFPLEANINTVSEEGLTAQADIFHLGCVIYSIANWKKFERNLFHSDWVRPLLRDLPNLDGLICGDVIQRCWLGLYSSMEQLHCEIKESLEQILRQN